jgi:hypothetical protein
MALAVLFFVIHWLTLPHYLSVHLHLHWGGYLTLIVAIATTVIGALQMKDAGESMPWEKGGGMNPSGPPAPPAPPSA